jgi:hypothetical protein
MQMKSKNSGIAKTIPRNSFITRLFDRLSVDASYGLHLDVRTRAPTRISALRSHGEVWQAVVGVARADPKKSCAEISELLRERFAGLQSISSQTVYRDLISAGIRVQRKRTQRTPSMSNRSKVIEKNV